MKALSHVVLVKIIITMLFGVFPLMSPVSCLTKIGVGVENGAAIDLSQVAVFLKLLGVAYLSLVVGYFLGYKSLKRNVFPCGTIVTGFVSNAGASITLLSFWRDWSKWDGYAPTFMWVSTIATGLIAALLWFFSIRAKTACCCPKK